MKLFHSDRKNWDCVCNNEMCRVFCLNSIAYWLSIRYKLWDDRDPSTVTVVVFKSKLTQVIQSQFLISCAHSQTDRENRTHKYNCAQPHITSHHITTTNQTRPYDVVVSFKRWRTTNLRARARLALALIRSSLTTIVFWHSLFKLICLT